MRSHSSKFMSKDVLKETIKFIVDNCQKNSEVSVSFFGGEALLRLDDIEETIFTLSKLLGDNVSFDISTNGLLLTDSNIQRIVMFPRTIISVSLDGCKSIHDKNRRDVKGGPTYDRIVSNLRHFQNAYPNEYQRRIRLLVTAGSLADVATMDDHYSEFKKLLGERSPLVSHVFPNFRMGLPYKDSLEQKRKFISDALEARKRGEENFHTLLLDNLTKKANKCTVGYEDGKKIKLWTCLDSLYSLFIDVSGKLFPCEKFGIDQSIGSIQNGLDFGKMRKMTYSYVLRRNIICSKCKYVEYCHRCLADSKMSISEQRKMCSDYMENINLAQQTTSLYEENI